MFFRQFLLIMGVSSSLFASSCCNYPFFSTTECQHITAPIFDGGMELGGGWLFLQPGVSDGDLEYGSLITLTDDPDNLTAHMLELTPSFRSGYRGRAGYRFPCTNWSVAIDGFFYRSKDSDSVDGLRDNQFIQNFLGGSFLTAEASEKQKMEHYGLSVGKHWLVDGKFQIHPFVGVGYGRLQRDLDVLYKGYNGDTTSANLPGVEKSCFWGVGPFAGVRFSHPLFCSITLDGHVGGGAFIGNLDASAVSNFTRNGTYEEFWEDSCRHVAVPFLNSGIELAFTYAFPWDCIGFKLAVGYEVDYYFNAVDRINPNNGYVNNPNTFPVRKSSHLGVGGPYVYLSLIDYPVPKEQGIVADFVTSCCPRSSGFFVGMNNSFLAVSPSDQDLVYGLLHTENQEETKLHADPSMTWAGSYYLGYLLPCRIDFQGRYFHYETGTSTETTAGENQEISSLNASGPADVRFGFASSKVDYDLDQFTVIVGKYIQPCRILNFHTYVGARYAALERRQKNSYLDGDPSLTTETKIAKLKSSMCGMGPMFGFDPEFSLCGGLALSGHASVSLLVGNIKSTLDQENTGSEGDTSNNLRIRKTERIMPVVDLRGGLSYCHVFKRCFTINMEVGYQFIEYYRSINQVYPTLLTGLEQTNSNFKLRGPYVSVDLVY